MLSIQNEGKMLSAGVFSAYICVQGPGARYFRMWNLVRYIGIKAQYFSANPMCGSCVTCV